MYAKSVNFSNNYFKSYINNYFLLVECVKLIVNDIKLTIYPYRNVK